MQLTLIVLPMVISESKGDCVKHYHPIFSQWRWKGSLDCSTRRLGKKKIDQILWKFIDYFYLFYLGTFFSYFFDISKESSATFNNKLAGFNIRDKT